MSELKQNTPQDFQKGFAIPPQPEILRKIQTESQNEYPDINQISSLIATDVGLSAYIMRVINSPAYGMNRTISDIKQASMFLGLNSLYNMISYYELRNAFKDMNCCISLERFWDGSSESAKLCSLIVKHLNLSGQCPVEYAHSIGLFHDCGIPAMAIRFDDYKETLHKINNQKASLFTDMENMIYRTNHATVGFYLLASWNMPKFICEFVARHHDPDMFLNPKSDPIHRDLFGILKLADNALSQYRSAKDDNEWTVLKTDVLAYFGMSDEDHKEFEANLLDDFAA